jgi:iron complex outermembrane receptor protein
MSGGAYAQTAPAPDQAAGGSEEVVKLSPFTVSTDKDYGYRASNSIAGTRTNTPIKDVPLNIQVFTKDLADDLVIKNQVDLEAYNASLVYGGADHFSDNPIQQPYQNFLFRGFRQNWGLRDGIREYDPLDIQGIARVEVVKGPAAALYGLAYPGGVMNNISKSVDFARNFVSTRVTAGGEGDWRATVDANVTGKVAGGRLGIRYNGAYEESADVREHSDGKIKFQQISLNWQPTENTTIEFLAEHGYRAIPNGINNNDGYTTFGSPAGEAGNHSDIPLQILRPDIPWDWNWSSGQNFRSLEINLKRLTVTQKLSDDFQVQAYYQYSDRLNIDGNGWDASGSGGADSWESAGSGFDLAANTVTSTYHYRDWGNKMHAYGATAVYKLDVAGVKNTFAFGTNIWQENELTRASRPLNPAASAIVYELKAGVATPIPRFIPSDVVPETDGGPFGNGYHHEDNSNDYYFANWQASWFGERLKTNLGVNRTNFKLVTWNSGASTSPDNQYTVSKWSPLAGGVFEINKEVSVFGVYSTSLFPDSTKDSFGNQFAPQVGKSLEAGFKVELMDGKVSGTVSYFRIQQTGGTQQAPNHENQNTVEWDRLTDAQRALRFPGKTRADLFAAGDIVAGGKQESKGIDIDIVLQPTRQWQTVLSFEHVDHKYVTSLDPSAPVGTTFPNAIKDRYSLLSRYEFNQGEVKGLYTGVGISGGSKSLADYQTWGGRLVARYTPARVVGEVFGGYKFKIMGYNSIVQLNIKNIFKTPVYAGWKSTGSASTLATERYKVPTPIVYRLTWGMDF